MLLFALFELLEVVGFELLLFGVVVTGTFAFVAVAELEVAAAAVVVVELAEAEVEGVAAALVVLVDVVVEFADDPDPDPVVDVVDAGGVFVALLTSFDLLLAGVVAGVEVAVAVVLVLLLDEVEVLVELSEI